MDNLVQAGVLGNSSGDFAISGRMYNRGICSYKPAYEAFHTLLLENMESIYETDGWNKFFISASKEKLANFPKNLSTSNNTDHKIPGNFRPSTDCFSTKKIILQKTQEIWQAFCRPFWRW